MDKATTTIDTISKTCIAVRLRLLNRVITNFYDDALRHRVCVIGRFRQVVQFLPTTEPGWSIRPSK